MKVYVSRHPIGQAVVPSQLIGQHGRVVVHIQKEENNMRARRAASCQILLG